MFGDLMQSLLGLYYAPDDGAGDGGDDSGGGGDDDDLLNGAGGDDGGDDGDGDRDGDGGDDGDGDGSDDGLDINALVDQLEQRLGDRFDAVADRRINALLQKLEKQQGGKAKNGKTDDDSQERAPVADVRAARSAFREYVSDADIRFLNTDERAFAMDLGQALIAQRAVAGFDDDDVVGREVASEVVKRVKGLRKLYETQTKNALRRKGLLVDNGKGQATKGPNAAGAQSEFDKGKQLAKERFADREAANA